MKYQDLAEDVPTFVTCTINWMDYPMIPKDGVLNTLSSGEIFTVTVNGSVIGLGSNHKFNFSASDIKYLAVVSFLLLTSTVMAQPGPGGPMMREKIRERIKTMKIWRLTEDVGLTTGQSEKFFPLYNQHQKDMEYYQKLSFQSFHPMDY